MLLQIVAAHHVEHLVGKDLGVIGRVGDLGWHLGGHAPAVAWAARDLTLVGDGVEEGARAAPHAGRRWRRKLRRGRRSVNDQQLRGRQVIKLIIPHWVG